MLRFLVPLAARCVLRPCWRAQWMELQGFLTINWAALHAWLGAKAQLLDQNGDGKLDAKDAHVLAVRAARCQRLHAERARARS